LSRGKNYYKKQKAQAPWSARQALADRPVKSFFDFIGGPKRLELLKANASRKILEEAVSGMKTG